MFRLLDYIISNFARNFKNALTGYAVYDYYSPSLDKIMIVIAAGLMVLIFIAKRTMQQDPNIQIAQLIFEAKTALNYDNLELAKHRYLQIVTIYDKLNEVDKSKYYDMVMQLYNERKSKEQMFFH